MLILFTLMMEAMLYSETSILTRDIRLHIAEDGALLIANKFTAYLKVQWESRCPDITAREGKVTASFIHGVRLIW
jgi:hypothetical protein